MHTDRPIADRDRFTDAGPAVSGSVQELIAVADGPPRPIVDGAGKSGAILERLTIGGVPHVLKVLDPSIDWTLRAVDSQQHCAAMWERGLLHRLPACLNQPIVGVARETRSDGTVIVGLLMRDVGPSLVPVSDEPITLDQHRAFLAHMAAMHVQFWMAGPEIDLVPLALRYLELSPRMARREAELGSSHLVPRLVGEGWERFAELAPDASGIVMPLLDDPAPFVSAVSTTPLTLLHGNWKLDNLGTDEQARTVVLDWEAPGRGPGTTDLAWYLAINCRRVPTSKEESIETYRGALESLGVDTAPWWERQLALGLLGAMLHFGWEKALGGRDDEFEWWESHAIAGAEHLA